MLEPFIQYIILAVIILFFGMLAQKLKIAYPIVLVIGGLGLSLLSVMPAYNIDPELIFVIILPPLLFEAAWYTSWKEFWKWRRVITSFAFPIVIVTSFVIALVSSYIIPGFTLAMGFLLGGIISPPDAVSAATILKQVTVPKRLSAILEGESLLNDASSLIVFRFALIAVDTGRFIFHEAAMNFVVVIVMGILIGIVIALIYYAIHKWLPTSTETDIILTLTAPYAMYITAESFHFSGVLAVVSGGLFLSIRSHKFLSARSRLHGANVWSTVTFMLNGLVFMLIGLELPVIVESLGDGNLGEAIRYGLIITGVLIISRMACTLGASAFTVFISRYIRTADSRPGWRGPVLLGWAGMRGVVSLAAALSIPLFLSDGNAFPQRNMILFITFTVILITLVVQGLTLPLMIRLVNMKDTDHQMLEEEQIVHVKTQLSKRSLQFLDTDHNEKLRSNKLLSQLSEKLKGHIGEPEEGSEEERKEFRKIYLELLAKQRHILVDLNKNGDIDEDVIRKFQALTDLEEERILYKN